MVKQEYDIGMIGLGVMGRNMALNMTDHGYSVAGFDKDPIQVQALQTEAEGRMIRPANSLQGLISSLRSPRAIMMLVPAGPPVDAVIQDLMPHLDPGDLIIDGGNSYFKDTDLRAKTLAENNLLYLGVGVSGGEYGARHGPSLMPGGPKLAYERVRPILEAVAAKADGTPCVVYLGPGSAGHFVKMVHNGIEYGLMRLIADTYDLMKRGMGLSDDELSTTYSSWNQKGVNSYLIEITANIFREIDERTSKRLIDVILDEAKQNGTGKWTSQSAMDLQMPVPTIDMAVAMRDLSVLISERELASRALACSTNAFQGEREPFLNQLRNALYAGMVITYAQGMAVLRAASQAYAYNLNLEDVARIWRAGCIIRAGVLDKISSAYHAQPDLPNLLLDRILGNEVLTQQADLRTVVCTSVGIGIPIPALMASLAYFDSYRSAWLPANLIQAQRDYFGAHSYERVDTKGCFHTHWIGES